MANPNAHIHVQFLTQMTVLVGNLGFQSMTDHYETPCTIDRSERNEKKRRSTLALKKGITVELHKQRSK